MLRFLATTALVLTAGSALAQTTDPMQAAFDQEIARWKVQQSAAERDIKLVDQVRSAFYKAAKLSNGAPQALEVNAALTPLKTRYPDYRLRYVTGADYCRISRALDDARVAALNRMHDSLNSQLKIMALSQSYNRIVVSMIAGQATGRPFTQTDIERAFRDELDAERKDNIQTDWDGMDTLMAPAAGEEDCA